MVGLSQGVDVSERLERSPVHAALVDVTGHCAVRVGGGRQGDGGLLAGGDVGHLDGPGGGGREIVDHGIGLTGGVRTLGTLVVHGSGPVGHGGPAVVDTVGNIQTVFAGELGPAAAVHLPLVSIVDDLTIGVRGGFQGDSGLLAAHHVAGRDAGRGCRGKVIGDADRSREGIVVRDKAQIILSTHAHLYRIGASRHKQALRGFSCRGNRCPPAIIQIVFVQIRHVAAVNLAVRRCDGDLDGIAAHDSIRDGNSRIKIVFALEYIPIRTAVIVLRILDTAGSRNRADQRALFISGALFIAIKRTVAFKFCSIVIFRYKCSIDNTKPLMVISGNRIIG